MPKKSLIFLHIKEKLIKIYNNSTTVEQLQFRGLNDLSGNHTITQDLGFDTDNTSCVIRFHPNHLFLKTHQRIHNQLDKSH